MNMIPEVFVSLPGLYSFMEHYAIGTLENYFRSCFDLFEMFFEVKKSSSSSRFFSQIVPLSSLEEAVEPEVFHSQIFKQTNQNSFLVGRNLFRLFLLYLHRNFMKSTT